MDPTLFALCCEYGFQAWMSGGSISQAAAAVAKEQGHNLTHQEAADVQIAVHKETTRQTIAKIRAMH